MKDAVKAVPFLGIALILIPLAWSDGRDDTAAETGRLIFIFFVWLLLIGLSILVTRLLRLEAERTEQNDETAE